LERTLVNQIAEKLDKIPDLALNAGVAYSGTVNTGHWTGGLLGLLGLKLATAPNLPAALSGIGLLSWLGLCGLPADLPPPAPPPENINTSGTGASGTGGVGPQNYSPPQVIGCTVQECINQGGTVQTVYPNTIGPRCSCLLPGIPQPTPPNDGGGPRTPLR